jgi:hypothetical protein
VREQEAWLAAEAGRRPLRRASVPDLRRRTTEEGARVVRRVGRLREPRTDAEARVGAGAGMGTAMEVDGDSDGETVRGGGRQAMQPVAMPLPPAPPPATETLFTNDFIQSVANGLDEFVDVGLFRGDGDLNFERDFGQWFNPDDVAMDLGVPPPPPPQQQPSGTPGVGAGEAPHITRARERILTRERHRAEMTRLMGTQRNVIDYTDVSRVSRPSGAGAAREGPSTAAPQVLRRRTWFER